MTEAEARATAKTLRQSMIGAAADHNESGEWGVRPWAMTSIAAGLYTDTESMPAPWQRELSRTQ